MIARLENVPLRELWPNEAHDFTVWLSNNLDYLGQELGLALSFLERETAVGAFSSDIRAEDENGNQIIIENQLEQTDHDHLGKLITYLSNLDAKIAIWITNAPRPEHEAAIHWLNEFAPADVGFYLVKLEAYRIGDSLPAPKFSIVAAPSLEAKEFGKEKKELAERHQWRLEFWKQLLERAKASTPLHTGISPSKENWISTGAGKTGLYLNYVIRMKDARVELYIYSGDADWNKAAYDFLLAHKNDIEVRMGAALEWQRLNDKRACRISYRIESGGLAESDTWPELQDAMIDAMIRLEKALRPEIERLPV